jgi:transposase-like protein
MPIRRRPGAADAEEAPLGVAAVARRLGVATGTLRTWDRRYGLGPSEHVSGTRRRYTPVDLSRLGVMRRLMLQGVAASEAAAVAVATRDRDLPEVNDRPRSPPLAGGPAPAGGAWSPPAMPVRLPAAWPERR